nr:proline-rich receptor-like protein kinase PERK8 [Aegilops tauschii subsp. strangulata]
MQGGSTLGRASELPLLVTEGQKQQQGNSGAMQGLGKAASPETGRNKTETAGSDGGALEMARSGPEADRLLSPRANSAEAQPAGPAQRRAPLVPELGTDSRTRTTSPPPYAAWTPSAASPLPLPHATAPPPSYKAAPAPLLRSLLAPPPAASRAPPPHFTPPLLAIARSQPRRRLLASPPRIRATSPNAAAAPTPAPEFAAGRICSAGRNPIRRPGPPDPPVFSEPSRTGKTTTQFFLFLLE